MNPINIQVFVDVIALLSGSPVEKSVFLFDDGQMGSTAKGTPGLVSHVWPGQFVRWTIAPVDVQTQVWIDSIEFGTVQAATADVVTEGEAEAATEPTEKAVADTAIWGRKFEGFVPLNLRPNTPHPYAIHLGFGKGVGKRVRVDGASLVFPIVAVPAAQQPIPQTL